VDKEEKEGTKEEEIMREMKGHGMGAELEVVDGFDGANESAGDGQGVVICCIAC
jgi:hypothetical protein